MNRFTRLPLLLFCFACAAMSHAQGLNNALRNDLPEWVRLMYQPNADPGAVEAAFNSYYATHRFEKNTHTQYYKRWKRQLGHDQVPLDPAQRATYPTDLRAYQDATAQLASARAANWTCIGPIDWDHGAVDKSYAAGAAHVYTVEQAPSDGNIVFAGTATAGLWKSTDKGLNWTNVTKAMMVGEVLSVEIASTDANTVWFGAEGDLFKSTNGGANWAVVGDATFNAQQYEIRDIALLPGNDQVLFVCSDKGLYRSSNGGTSFTQVQTGTWQEIEFKPGTPATVYAVKRTGNLTQFWRSTDSGLTFTQQTGGWPVPLATDEQERTEIAVTPADPNVVYALATGVADGGSGLYGIYKSTDSGSTWTFQCCGSGPAGVPSPTNMNLMGWSDAGTDDGGQYYYDLALAADPANANALQVGGVNRWVSTDGGVTFTCPAKWSHSYKVDYVHADIHDIRYYGAEIWVACDGGAFYSSNGGTTFERRIHGIAGTDFWGFGVGGWTGSQVMLGGTYHNGTLLKDNNVYQNGWVSTDGGDGIRGFVHPQYDRRALSDYGYKTLSGDRLSPNGNTAWSRQPNGSYIVGESSELAWHPNRVNTAFLGNGNGLWRTDDNGVSFTLVHDFGAKVTSIEVAFSAPDHLYVCTYPGWWDTKRIWRSTDGGSSWTDITPTSAQLNGNTWVPYDIAVSATDPLLIWMVRTSMYGNSPNMNGFVAYRSSNGGTTWTNITDAGLNGEWPTNIAHQFGSAGELYIGTRRAVYRRSDATPQWTLWNAGLPAKVQSTRLLINYRQGLIRNGTDRSVWESPLEQLAPPVANFAVDNPRPTCLEPGVVYFDNSALHGDGATWSWSFPGGNPTTGTGRTAQVTYSAPGTYSATLTVTDANGTSTRTITNIVTFEQFSATAPSAANAEDQMAVPNAWRRENPDNDDTWENVAVTTGADGNPGRAWRMDYYYYNAPGQQDRFVSPVISLAGSAGTRLQFHHAYKPYGASYTDALRVEISTDCGASWTSLFYQEALALGTTTSGTSPWAPSAAAHWRLTDIDLSAYDGMAVVIRFTGVNDYGDRLYLDNINLLNNGLRMALKLFLDGPYDNATGTMRDDLRTAGLLPTTEPYTAAGWTQAADGGGEVVQAGVFNKTGNDAIVDWVMVELSTAATPGTAIATRPALLQRDGDVVAEDGSSPIALRTPPGSYHVRVRHRNHLGAMTAQPVALTTTATALDLTNGSTPLHGTEPTRTIGAVQALWAGNVLRDQLLKYTGAGNDRDPILVAVGSTVPTNTTNGYRVEDVNLDGVVRYSGANNDRDIILRNVGGTVPTTVRSEQLP